MKRIALLTLGFLMVCNCAFATVYELGAIDIGEEYSDIFSVAPGSFSDRFNFSILGSDLNGYGESFFSVNRKGTIISEIEDFKITLYDSVGKELIYALDADSFTTSLLEGSYYILATGKAIGSAGAAYSLSVSSAVPVPAAALLLGAGLLGIVGIRRRQLV